jgi:hypothetical protein
VRPLWSSVRASTPFLRVERHAQVGEARHVGGEAGHAGEQVDRGWTGATAGRGGVGLPPAAMICW